MSFHIVYKGFKNNLFTNNISMIDVNYKIKTFLFIHVILKMVNLKIQLRFFML